MARDRRFDDAISRWLEQSASPRLPDRVLEATFERTRGSRQHLGWRERVPRLHLTLAAPALGAAAVVVVLTAALGLGLFASQPRVGGPAVAADPRIPFLDTWLSADPDGSRLTMTIRASGEEALEILVIDDVASVCSGASSSMTGTGRLEAPGRLVIPSPVYSCDDGSEPEALSGPPLVDQLRNLTFVLDQQTDALTDSLRSVWVRDGAPPPGSESRDLQPVWPQTSREAVREAQERADAGDPAFTWQVDPGLAGWQDDNGSEILARFLREQLGWEAFRTVGWGMGGTQRRSVVRCAPGRTNPLYPNDTRGGGCAPTIDEVRYEHVGIDLYQPIRRDPTGIWVVTRFEMLEPLEQTAPPSDAEVTGLVDAFLRARIAGRGAEPFVDVGDESSSGWEVPLLYATSGGAPYERGEFEVVDGPTWQSGWMRLRVRLFADGGATVVEQWFHLEPPIETGRASLHYPYRWDGPPTTENGAPVAVEYGFIPDEVTFRAAWPWFRDTGETQSPRLINLVTGHDVPDLYQARLAVVADPRPIERGCEEGPAPSDAAALARSILADPDLEATAPVAVTVGGLPALQMDVDQAPGASLCDEWGQALAVTAGLVGEPNRVRLYVLDLHGRSVRTLAIALTASKEEFERVMLAAAPILESFRFDPD